MKRVFRLPAYRRLLAAYTLNELAWSIVYDPRNTTLYVGTDSGVYFSSDAVIVIFVFSNRDIGQPALALLAAVSNAS